MLDWLQLVNRDPLVLLGVGLPITFFSIRVYSMPILDGSEGYIGVRRKLFQRTAVWDTIICIMLMESMEEAVNDARYIVSVLLEEVVVVCLAAFQVDYMELDGVPSLALHDPYHSEVVDILLVSSIPVL